METWDYRKLHVWTRARDLAVVIHRTTAADGFRGQWALRDQMRRASISVPSNIAEGNQREGPRICAHYLSIAKGSLAELSTQIEISVAIGAMPEADAAPCLQECDELRRMLAALVRKRPGRF